MNIVPGKDAYVNSVCATVGDVNLSATGTVIPDAGGRDVNFSAIGKRANLAKAIKSEVSIAAGKNLNSNDTMNADDPKEEENVYYEIPYVQPH